MMQAFFLVTPPTVLFRPNIVARSLLRRKRVGQPTPTLLRPNEAEDALAS